MVAGRGLLCLPVIRVSYIISEPAGHRVYILAYILYFVRTIVLVGVGGWVGEHRRRLRALAFATHNARARVCVYTAQKATNSYSKVGGSFYDRWKGFVIGDEGDGGV